ncbi:MAG: VWA domain-containing protein [Acidimicrobiales bacterium]
MNLSFLDPAKLLFLLIVAALAAAYVVLQRRRSQYAVRFTNLALLDQIAPKRPGWRRHAAAAGLIVAIASLVLAYARPTHPEKIPRERATIVLAVDVSLSMEADDVRPTRLDALRSAAKQFLDAVPPKINVGLVSFAGTARVAVAPTTDRGKVATGITRLQLAEGTAIGEAIFTSLDAIDQVAQETPAGQEPVPAAIVLMSDGQTRLGRPNDEAAAAAHKASVPVTTIAFGTDHGTIADPQTGERVPVPVDKAALRDIADATGGTFFAASTEGELSAVYQDIGSSIGYEEIDKEITTWFIGAALVALVATAVMSLAWFSRLP